MHIEFNGNLKLTSAESPDFGPNNSIRNDKEVEISSLKNKVESLSLQTNEQKELIQYYESHLRDQNHQITNLKKLNLEMQKRVSKVAASPMRGAPRSSPE